MKNFILLLLILLTINNVFAEPYKITPVEKITTANKNFRLGNVYSFRKIDSDDIIKGAVVFYRPNGCAGQEAQIEIANFRDKNGKLIPGEISIIPDNHKKVQEYMNYFSLPSLGMIRGSEIVLKPNIHIFEINNEKEFSKYEVLSIMPEQEISTTYDEIEIGDFIKFKTITETSNIKSDTAIYGVVDYLDENSWCGDNAIIYFKKFITYDKRGKKIVLNSELQICGFETLKYKTDKKKQFFNYIGVVFRGKEVDIKKSDTNVTFNLILK